MKDDDVLLEIPVAVEDAPMVAHVLQFLRNDCMMHIDREAAARYDEIYKKVAAVIPESAAFFDRYEWFLLVSTIKEGNEWSVDLVDSKYDWRANSKRGPMQVEAGGKKFVCRGDYLETDPRSRASRSSWRNCHLNNGRDCRSKSFQVACASDCAGGQRPKACESSLLMETSFNMAAVTSSIPASYFKRASSSTSRPA